MASKKLSKSATANARGASRGSQGKKSVGAAIKGKLQAKAARVVKAASTVAAKLSGKSKTTIKRGAAVTSATSKAEPKSKSVSKPLSTGTASAPSQLGAASSRSKATANRAATSKSAKLGFAQAKPSPVAPPMPPGKGNGSRAKSATRATSEGVKAETTTRNSASKQKGAAARDAAGDTAGEQGSAVELSIGNAAPRFELQDDAGKKVSSEDLRGSAYVLYFYPKDDTPGCTLEACGFRDSLPRFSAKGVKVLGVSPDSPDTHTRFRKKYGLTFPLLSDPDKTLAKAYGVWVKKLNYGREYMGVERSTFVIDKQGKIKQIWRSVRVPGHVDAVLDGV